MCWTIWYHLYNLKNVKNTHGALLLLVKLQAKACNFTKSNSPPWVIFMGGSIKPLAEISFSTLQSTKCFWITSFYTYFFVYYLADKINFGPLFKGQPHLQGINNSIYCFRYKIYQGLSQVHSRLWGTFQF